MNSSSFKIGLFANGLAAYWEEFPGLQEKPEGYLDHVHKIWKDFIHN